MAALCKLAHIYIYATNQLSDFQC